jgi:hypothetical protein
VSVMATTDSNIEPLAREIAERVCRKTGSETTAQEVATWVDSHWQCAAADLEAGRLNDDGSRIDGVSWESGLAAYLEMQQREASGKG